MARFTNKSKALPVTQSPWHSPHSFTDTPAMALGGISRKWLIPLLEFYDRIGATRRDGNLRRLTNKGRAMAEGGIDVV